MKTLLETGLILCAAGQFCIALLNFALVRILRWKPDLDRLPLLLRQVFYIHDWFIGITLLIFATFTFRFAGPLAAGADPACRWVACSIGAFWAIRAVMQVTYYSSAHWKGIPSRTAVHIILLFTYPIFAIVYLAAGIGI